MFTTHENLAKNGVIHGFFGRRGGGSGGIYDSLNCGPGTQDDPENVARNRAAACAALGSDPAALLTLYQVHSADCVTVTAPWSGERPKADALVTDRPGLALGVLTADCAPVLLCGEKPDGAPVIGAAHAGWGGALKGVVESTVGAMEALGAVPETLRAAIGPCIGPDSYEVGVDFRAEFLKQGAQNAAFFLPAVREGHWMFDLPAYVLSRLSVAGVAQAGWLGRDTFSDEKGCFSFRRATHRGEPDCGRQLSVMVLA